MIKKSLLVLVGCVVVYGTTCWIILTAKPSFLISAIESHGWGHKKWLSRSYKFSLLENAVVPYGYCDAILFCNKFYSDGCYKYLKRDDFFDWYEFENDGNVIRFISASEFISNTIDTFKTGEMARLEIVNHLSWNHEMRYTITSSVVRVNKISLR